jgi:FtsZ-interacting cell division protein ZipA
MPYEFVLIVLLVVAGLWWTRHERAAALRERDG